MGKYFASNSSLTKHVLAPFSKSHLLILLVLTIINIAFFILLKKGFFKKSFKYYLAGFLLFNEIFYIIWCILAGIWSFGYSLPLQLCDITAILSIYMLFSNNRKFFNVLYFWGLGGALQALLTPAMHYSFPHALFFNFFFLHYSIITAVFYMLIIDKCRPTLKSIFSSLFILNIYAIIIFPVNKITHGNYMFLSHKPSSHSVLDYLGKWPWYILSLEGVYLIICFILFIPFIFLPKKDSFKSLLK